MRNEKTGIVWLIMAVFVWLPYLSYASTGVFPDPVIDSLSHSAVIPGNTRLVLSGKNFGDTFYPRALLMGETEVSKLIEWTDSEIIFIVPVNVNANRIYLSAGHSNGYRSQYIHGPYYHIQPVINGYHVDMAKAGDTIDVLGSFFKDNFASDKSVIYSLRAYFGDTEVQVVSWDKEKIKVDLPLNAKSNSFRIILAAKDLGLSLQAKGPVLQIELPLVDDEFFYLQSYLEQMNIPVLWDHSTGARDVVVAVIDDGVFLNHPDLKKNIWSNGLEIPFNNQDDDKNGYIDDVYGWNFVKGSGEIIANGFHGTMVAGLIAAQTDNGEGIAGVARNVKIMPIVICASDTDCRGEKMNEAIHYAVDNGADIINLSLGTLGSTGYSKPLDEGIEYAYDHGVILVASSGNGDIEGSGDAISLDTEPLSPVCNDGNSNRVLGVGSLGDDNKPTSWSNYGKCVDVLAPGESIFSLSTFNEAARENMYAYGQGTSFSAPLISGVAAVLKGIYPQKSNRLIMDQIISASLNKVFNAALLFDDGLKSNLKNNDFVLLERSLVKDINKGLAHRLSGMFLLQVELVGQAWYVYPNDYKKYYLGRPADAFDIMRKLGLGVRHDFMSQGVFPGRVWGKILIDVDDLGKAYYIYPKNGRAFYLGRPSDALEVMRTLGLGISNDDIRKLEVGLVR